MGRPAINLIGRRFGRLTVIERAEKPCHVKNIRAYWKCVCNCGNEIVLDTYALTSGQTQSCGCLRKEQLTVRNTIHGKSSTSIYHTWQHIKSRCFNSNDKAYKNYGRRGISVCPDWIDNFQAFYDYVSQLEHFGEEGYTLDRINNNGNYEPDNLRWATAKIQRCNQRRNNFVECEGKLMTLKGAAEKSGINYGTLKCRYRAGDREDRLFRPVKSVKPKE